MIRIFCLHDPKLPVAVICERCGEPVRIPRKNSPTGEQWISGDDLIQYWLDHQLINCTPKEVNDEGSSSG